LPRVTQLSVTLKSTVRKLKALLPNVAMQGFVHSQDLIFVSSYLVPLDWAVVGLENHGFWSFFL
jgi:hypothetical protein